MPYYELECLDCRILFELGSTRGLNVSEIFCLDCGSLKLKVINYDSKISTRITRLIENVKNLAERLEELEYITADSNDRHDAIEVKKPVSELN